MGSWVTRNLKQRITYWATGAPDGFGGVAFSTPVTIKARWEDVSDLFVDSQGREVRSAARVYVDQDVSLGGYLYNGVSTTSDPTTVDGAQEIKDFKKTPTLDNKYHERRVLL